jgi:hypothetical protein
VIVTGLSAGESAPYETALAELGLELMVEADPAEAEKKLRDERFDAVVAGYPLATGAIGRLMSTLRARGGHNSSTGLVLLAERDRLRGAAGLVGRGVHKALSKEEDPAVLGIVVQRMIDFAQPMAERLPVHLEVSATVNGENIVWRTENLSGSGMLIGTTSPPAMGSLFPFTLQVPGLGEVEGEAKVVRHTAVGREPVDGFGARFVSFAGDGQNFLLIYLRSAIA